MAFWIWPVPGEHDMFWLVGTSASSRPGHMAYLDWGFYGTTWVWPFHPDRPDSMSEWQFIPTAPSQIDDTEETKGFLPSHYSIVSGPRSRDPNKMLYLADDGLPPTRLPLPFGSIRTPQESQHAELGAEHADRERPGRLEAAASSVRRRPVLPGAVAVAVAAAAVAATTLAAANLAAASRDTRVERGTRPLALTSPRESSSQKKAGEGTRAFLHVSAGDHAPVERCFLSAWRKCKLLSAWNPGARLFCIRNFC